MTSTLSFPQAELLSEAGEVSTTHTNSGTLSLCLVLQGLRGRENFVAPSLQDTWIHCLMCARSWGSKQGSGDPNGLIWLTETPGNAGVDTSQGTRKALWPQ